MNFEFMNNPIVPGYENQPQPPFGNQMNMQNMSYQQPMMPPPQPMAPQYYQPPAPVQMAPIAETNTNNNFGFTVRPDNAPLDPKFAIVRDTSPSSTTSKKRGRKKSTDTAQSVEDNSLVSTEPTDAAVVEDTPTLYNYTQTTMLLHNTLQQADMIAAEIKQELDSVRSNRTLRNKHNYIVGLANGLSQILNTKASLIREINNSITKSVELDYRKEKDRKAAETALNDDRYIMDIYNAFVQNPNSGGNVSLLGPSALSATVNSIDSNSIIRSQMQANPVPDNQPVDIGYLNYLNRITPEQNAMFYENDPNVKTVVVFDVSTGNKFFQVMNMATGQVVPNVPVLDNRFMEDTTIDLKNNIARNNNLHETYPLVVLNEGVTNEY